MGFVECLTYTFTYLGEITLLMVGAIIDLFKGQGLESLSGPIGMYSLTSEAVHYGFASYLSLLGIISLNIGLFNALPLPVMDGGRVVLTFIEMLTGHPVNKKLEASLMAASVIILFALIIFASFQDILRLF